MTTALVAGVATGLGGATLVELLATRPRAARRRRARLLLPLLAALGRGGTRGSSDRDLEARIEAAGANISAAELAAIRTGSAFVAFAAVGPVAWASSARGALVLLIAAPAAAYAAPTAILRRRAGGRAAIVAAETADVLDLLAVALDAGLTPARAAAEVGRRHRGLLAAELRRMAGRRALGVPAASTIDDLERRCPTEGVAALCGALRRAERHGAPLAMALRAQSRQARSRDAARTAEAAARASPRMQLVVALLLVPSVLLLVAAGLLPALTG